MSRFTQWFSCFSLSLILSSVLSQGVSDDESNVPLTPFQLSYTPAHVVNHLTHDITILCAHEGDNSSQLEVISWIRLLKKLSNGWQLLAELRDIEPEPRVTLNVSVAAQLSQNVRDSFLQVTWPVATPDTFGTYRCDVIGLRASTLHVATEVTSELAILEEEITASDMLDIFKKNKDDLSSVVDTTDRLKNNMNMVNAKLNSFHGELDGQDEEVVVLGRKIKLTRKNVAAVRGDVVNLTGVVNSLVQKIDILNEAAVSETANELGQQITSLADDVSLVNRRIDDVRDEMAGYHDTQNEVQQRQTIFYNNIAEVNTALGSLKREISDLKSAMHTQYEKRMAWPAGQFALLQPRTGCPEDFTFREGDDKYFKIHTESSSIGNFNLDSFSVLPPGSLSTEDSQNFFTLRFCEGFGSFSAKSWPQGSYCINGINMGVCPDGFSSEIVYLDTENDNPQYDYTSRVVFENRKLRFCCMTSGTHSIPIELPTFNPFLLYRIGGTCQNVKGMNVDEVYIDIDTEDHANTDYASSGAPDVDLTHTAPFRFYLCSYTEA